MQKSFSNGVDKVNGHKDDDDLSIPFYAQRSKTLNWRSNWFGLKRSFNEKELTAARDNSFSLKIRQIEKSGRGSGQLAGYDPAGAGSPWYSVGPRNVNGRVKSVAVHPTDPNTVYAGSAAGGVWKSSDGGQSWTALWDMQGSLAVGALGISKSAPNTIYAGTGEYTPGYIFSYAGVGIYVSTDAGTTWSLRNTVKSRRINKLVVDPQNSQRLWASGDQGLERSTDGAVTWTQLRTDAITDLTLDPTNSNTVFVAVNSAGFYKSTDSGTTFNLLPGAPTGSTVQFPNIAVGASGAHGHNFVVIKMGDTVETSIDGGTTFTTLPGGGGHGNFFPGWNDTLACAPDNEQIIFWGGIGLDHTADGGNTWTGLPVHSDQHAVVFAPSNSNIVYIVNDGGVYRSDDKGITVNYVSNGLVITQFYNINFWRTLSNVLGGGSQDTGVNYTTGGLTWTSIRGADGGWFIIDPTDPRIIYTETQQADIEKSTDGGQTWTTKTVGIVGTTPWEGVLTMDPGDHLRLYYGTDRILRSLDGLATAWTVCSQVLNGTVSAIAVAPSNSSRIYTGTASGGLYRSDDGGNSIPWADKSAGLPGFNVSSIVVSSNNTDMVFVSLGGITGIASSQCIYRSTDGGTSWSNVSGDLVAIVGNAVALDPSASNTWYLATDTGVFRTTNGGTNWLAFDNGIPNVPCSDLVMDTVSNILYCGTYGRGAYKLDVTPNTTKPRVDLYVRDNDEDTGEKSPSPFGLSDPLQPAPAVVTFWISPDIKVNHQPVFTPGGLFDGVIFDNALVHQDPFRGRTNRFYLQVHNRGWTTTKNVSVCVFVANASAGLPNLPNALVPPSFNLSSTANWQPVGTAQTIAELKPNTPYVVFWDYNIPASSATHTCCLAVISCADDPFTNTTTAIAPLVSQDKRVCLKNLHIIDPGAGQLPPTLTTIDFHNPNKSKGFATIVIKPVGFSHGTIGLLLPKITLTSREEAYQGVKVVQLRSDDPIGPWYGTESDERTKPLVERLASCNRTHLFEFDETKISSLSGIELDPGQTLYGVLVTSLDQDVSLTGPSTYDVIQLLDGKVVGGSTYQIGYNLPDPGTVPPPRRVRITADFIKVTHEKKNKEDACVNICVKITVADDDDRTYERVLGHPKSLDKETLLMDLIVMQGDSITISLLEAEGERGERMDTLFTRRFEGWVQKWLGSHSGSGKEGLRVEYKIEEVPVTAAQGGD